MSGLFAQAQADGPDGPLGALALYLTYVWLASAIVCAYLSQRKGYGERPGLAAGLLLNVIGVVLWIVWPAKGDSMWKTHGPWGTTRKAPSPAAPPDAPPAPEKPPAQA